MNFNPRDPDPQWLAHKKALEVKKESLEIKKIMYNKLSDEQTAVIMVVKYIALATIIIACCITTCNIADKAITRITKTDLYNKVTEIEKELNTTLTNLAAADSIINEHIKNNRKLIEENKKQIEEIKKIEPKKEE